MLYWTMVRNERDKVRWSTKWRGLECRVHPYATFVAWSINTDSATLAIGREPTPEQAMAEVERRLRLLATGA